MITIELTKEQLSDVIRGIDFITKESERELSNMQFFGCNHKMAQMFDNDIKELKELKQYLKIAYENN
jgi:hypothetical protein